MRQFESMTSAEWREWLELALAGDSLDPPLQRANRELHQDLLAVFRDLPSNSALRMADAVGELIRVTSLVDNFAERLYLLLEVAATVKPQRIFDYLDRILRDEVGRRLFYANTDLHSNILAVLGRYDVDDRLVDYIDESAWRFGEWRYALHGFRIASLKSAQHGGRLLPLLIRLIEDDPQRAEVRTEQLAVQLAAVVLRHGHGDMVSVFLNISQRYDTTQTGVLAVALARAITVLPPPSTPKVEALRVVLLRSAEVVLGSIPLSNVWQVASCHRDTDVGLIEKTIAHIWRCEEPRYKDGPPWEVVTKSDEFLPADKNLTSDGDWIFRADSDQIRVDSGSDLIAFAVIAAIASRRKTSEAVR